VLAVGLGVPGAVLAVGTELPPEAAGESVKETGFRPVRLGEGIAVGVALGSGVTRTCGDTVGRGWRGDGPGAVLPETGYCTGAVAGLVR